MPSLYVTYTPIDLGEHGREARRRAEELGWTVVDGPDGLGLNRAERLKRAGDCDALLVLSAYMYSSGEQEQEWEAARKSGKPTRAILADPNKPWPPKLIEAVHNAGTQSALRSFQEKLQEPGSYKYFELDPASVRASASALLDELKPVLARKTQVRVFVVWDMTITGVDLMLTSLRKRPPEGFQIEVPGLEGALAAGEIFRDIVLPGIEQSHRVLVVTDRPNANVAFEAGLALGFGKPISLIHFGSDLPDWLKESAFKGFLVRAVKDVEELRGVLRDDGSWYKPAPAPPVPPHGATLFLSPSRYVGAALREEQRALFPHWKVLPDAFNLNDMHNAFAGVAQVVWSIASFSEGADVRDGAENAANGIISGWFYARAHRIFAGKAAERLSVVRQDKARKVADLEVIERQFHGIGEFEGHLRTVPDHALPEPLRLEEGTFGKADYKMVCLPPPGGGQPAAGQPRVWVGVYPVRNKEYKVFCEDAPHPPPVYWQREFDPDQPVVEVSLEDAEAFCQWAGLELPDPELWKRFTLAGSSGQYWWGDDESIVSKVAWHSANSGGRLHRVGEKTANTWAIHDALGNAWEWTKRYQELDQAPYSERQGLVWKAKVFGGAYDTSARDLNTFRVRDLTGKQPSIGFRCVRIE